MITREVLSAEGPQKSARVSPPEEHTASTGSSDGGDAAHRMGAKRPRDTTILDAHDGSARPCVPSQAGAGADMGSSPPVPAQAASASSSSQPFCWHQEPPVLAEFRRHRRLLVACYQTCSHVVPQICGWVVFSTAMYYIHRFVACHAADGAPTAVATGAVDPITLSAAAVFLASKAENFKVSLGAVVRAAFDCSQESDHHQIYKSMTLQVEVMLLATLGGRLTIIHPFAVLSELAPRETEVGRLASKLYSYTTMTPLCLYVPPAELAAALVLIAARDRPDEDTFVAAVRRHPAARSMPTDVRVVTELAMVDALVATSKRIPDIPHLDALVQRRQGRAAAGQGPRVARSAGQRSSGSATYPSGA